ncbi:glycoside hydrolase family 43 protein [Paucilactobacillus suebicus]|uniref:Glycosyl hydrolase family 43 n=1 Tax=Paucilactobacillus suebicus DSM 5007 = KCTC 3549 TaxID=1423807 RepID=A0A0R1W3P4_9LACO|nr:glycoside hydrolase family 43 protein [Paucilactobacillus suebicus]KRM12382.1 glycosyl hydrolase family 43 [Paucilactobacillus suebicus DSM 5007 = KCTC 3549]
MVKVANPVLPGFNPDPCLFRGKDAYYLLVSTFEFMPGIRVYQSNDLANWSYRTSILTDIDLTGNTRGCSIWAPFAAYHNGKYYVIYTDVKSTRVPYKDVNNYIITSDSIDSPWSEPKYINSSGFDPSIFFDDDGKIYFLNEYWDYRMSTHNKSAGILIQELYPSTLDVKGDPQVLFNGTEAKKTEAPEIYKHHGYYYLLTAEGGTEAGHQVTVARSKNVTGPYELDPQNPMLTSRDNPKLPLQNAGHASIVRDDNDNWYMAHLTTRPLKDDVTLLGRESAIQNVYWTDDDWLRLSNGTNQPDDYYTVPIDTDVVVEPHDFHDDFTDSKIDFKHWNTLRKMPTDDWLQLTGHGVTLAGGQSPQSEFDQHLIAKRQTDFNFSTSVTVEFQPTNYMQLAGLGLYLDIDNYLFLAITHDEKVGRAITLIQAVKSDFKILTEPIAISDAAINMQIDVTGLSGSVSFTDGDQHKIVNDNIDLSFLSGGFTGNFIALDTIDMGQFNRAKATFTDFDYKAK